MNKEWHLKHKSPAKGSKAQKIKWYFEHEKFCDCSKGRKVPAYIKEFTARRG